MSSRPLFQHFQTRYREGKYQNRCTATETPHDKFCQGHRMAEPFLLGALPFGRCTVHARTDGLPLTALVCADHTIPCLSSLVSSGIKNTQGKLLQTLFQTLKLRSIQVAFRTSCSPDRKRNAAHEKSWTTKSWIHGGNLDAYRHMRESTLKDPKRKTLETVARPVAAKRLEKKQWAAHGLFGVTKPFCTMMVDAAL